MERLKSIPEYELITHFQENYEYRNVPVGISNQLRKDNRLNNRDIVVWETIFSISDIKSKKLGYNIKRLTKLLSYSITTIYRALNNLYQTGWLDKKRGFLIVRLPKERIGYIHNDSSIRKKDENNSHCLNNEKTLSIYNTTKEKTINRDEVIRKQEDVKKTKRKEKIVTCSFFDKNQNPKQENSEQLAEQIEEKKEKIVKCKESIKKFTVKRQECVEKAKEFKHIPLQHLENHSRAESMGREIERLTAMVNKLEGEITQNRESIGRNTEKTIQLTLNIAEPSAFVMAKVKAQLWIYKQQKLISSVSEISDWIKYTIMNQMTDKSEMHAANICLKLVKEGRFTRPKNYEYYAEYLTDLNKSDTQLPVEEKTPEIKSDKEFKPVEKSVDIVDNNFPEILRAKENFNAVLQKLRLATA